MPHLTTPAPRHAATMNAPAEPRSHRRASSTCRRRIIHWNVTGRKPRAKMPTAAATTKPHTPTSRPIPVTAPPISPLRTPATTPANAHPALVAGIHQPARLNSPRMTSHCAVPIAAPHTASATPALRPAIKHRVRRRPSHAVVRLSQPPSHGPSYRSTGSEADNVRQHPANPLIPSGACPISTPSSHGPSSSVPDCTERPTSLSQVRRRTPAAHSQDPQT